MHATLLFHATTLIFDMANDNQDKFIQATISAATKILMHNILSQNYSIAFVSDSHIRAGVIQDISPQVAQFHTTVNPRVMILAKARAYTLSPIHVGKCRDASLLQ